MKYQLMFLLLLAFFSVQAQKKLVSVSESAVTGIRLPENSKCDKRISSIFICRVLLEIESKKAAVSIANPEVLILPAESVNGYTTDSLVNAISTAGWQIYPLDNDPHYAWLLQNGRTVLVYFSLNKRDTALYFSEAAGTPVLESAPIN